MATTPFKPTWAKHEKGIASADTKTQSKSADAFDEERKRETAVSKQARDWEADRKKEWAKNKPAYVKKRAKNEKENDPIEQFKSKLRYAGKHDSYFKPNTGYVLIKPDPIKASETESGIILPESAGGDLQNVGTVMANGGMHYTDLAPHLFNPVDEGARVVFKKGAGVDIDLKWGNCRLMMYQDILGILHD